MIVKWWANAGYWWSIKRLKHVQYNIIVTFPRTASSPTSQTTWMRRNEVSWGRLISEIIMPMQISRPTINQVQTMVTEHQPRKIIWHSVGEPDWSPMVTPILYRYTSPPTWISRGSNGGCRGHPAITGSPGRSHGWMAHLPQHGDTEWGVS